MINPPNEPTTESHDLSPTDLKFTPEQGTRERRHRIVFNNKEAVEPTLLIAESDRSHRSHKSRRQKRVRRILLAVLCVFLCLILVTVTTAVILLEQGRSELLASDVELQIPDNIVQNPQIEILDNGRTITHNGETYIFNENRTNILCIGMDKQEMGLENNLVGTAGQADVLVLVSLDTVTGKMDALTISRDTMVDINLYAADGSFHGVERSQICLAYAYGDGYETSCENVVRSASRLLYGIPINTYVAVDLSVIPTLNDAVGGVNVTLLKDFKRTNGTVCAKGENITLRGEEAERYVRDRDTALLDSNNERMERQKQYVSSFFEAAMTATKNDLQVPLELYNAVSDDCVTTLSPQKISFLASTLVQHDSNLAFFNVKGDVVEGDDGYAEYIVDDDALYEQILQIFYTKVS